MYVARGGIGNELGRRFHDLFCHMDWNVGIVDEPISAFVEGDAKPEVRWFPPVGSGRYLADPFGIVHDGRAYVFCEDFDYQSSKGVIAQIRLSEDGTPSDRQTAIEMPFHMSYPCLFEWHGEIYCVPETHQAEEIGLYRATRFPSSWTKEASLIPNFAGVDPTVFTHGGRWWISCTDQNWGPNNGLFLFYAPGPTGPWVPHSGNPVRRGLRGSRPAGTPFTHKGQLFRPAMDSPRTYGERILIYRVTRLSPTEFEEELASVVEPFQGGPYRYGVHTLSAVGDRTLVDGLRVTFEKVEFQRAWSRNVNEFLGFITPLWHKE